MQGDNLEKWRFLDALQVDAPTVHGLNLKRLGRARARDLDFLVLFLQYAWLLRPCKSSHRGLNNTPVSHQ